MILSVTLSKPTAQVEAALGAPYLRVKIKLATASGADKPMYRAELYTKTQVFHRKLTAAELQVFLQAHEGSTFRACVERTETEEITVLANKRGRVTRLVKPLHAPLETTGANATADALARGAKDGAATPDEQMDAMAGNAVQEAQSNAEATNGQTDAMTGNTAREAQNGAEAANGAESLNTQTDAATGTSTQKAPSSAQSLCARTSAATGIPTQKTPSDARSTDRRTDADRTFARLSPPRRAPSPTAGSDAHNRAKNYILREGVPVPFLVHLGVMTAQGKVIAAKYDKFRQINRFLEYIDDVLPAVLALRQKAGNAVSADRPLRVVDFGCGKSYLTFAVHHFLTTERHIPCNVTGLDLKADVIAYCTRLAEMLSPKAPTAGGLHFAVGDIARYGEAAAPDIVITLHACDTATDYALAYAVQHGAAAILSVPCCQHELNAQLSARRTNAVNGDDSSATAATGATQDDEVPPQQTNATAGSSTLPSPFAALLKHGILKERFAALATDALRAAYLEAAGYRVQVLEFIDLSHTPKNLLLRAVRKQAPAPATRTSKPAAEAASLAAALGVSQTLGTLLESR